MGRTSFAVAGFALIGLACGDHGGAKPDAGSDGIAIDATPALTLDIGVTGCGSYDAATALCAGTPPLELSFAPIGSPELIHFVWTFGDGTPSTTDRAPLHSFAHPGDYQVTVTGDIGGGQGTVPATRPVLVRVAALAVGAPCDVDSQCGDGLTCTCAPGTGCSPAFIRGICSAACGSSACADDASCPGTCPAGAVCGTVGVGGASAPDGLCLAPCQTDPDCTPAFVCRSVPNEAGPGRWSRGCLPLGLVGDVGASCRDASEALSDIACATGSCADVGALGVCSATCDLMRPCPPGSTCARLPDGRALCLADCASPADCAGDPLLACAQTPAAGTGSTLAAVCAPRSCANNDACPSGRCGPDGFCVRR